MSDPAEDLTGGSEADVQEQGIRDGAGDAVVRGMTGDGGTGGSEADLQEQGTVAQPGDAAGAGGIAGEGTGGSEADRLEQAADVPLDGEKAFPHAGTDDVPTV